MTAVIRSGAAASIGYVAVSGLARGAVRAPADARGHARDQGDPAVEEERARAPGWARRRWSSTVRQESRAAPLPIPDGRWVEVSASLVIRSPIVRSRSGRPARRAGAGRAGGPELNGTDERSRAGRAEPGRAGRAEPGRAGPSRTG